MRAGLILAVLLLSGCAHERLAQSPPPGVNLSGHWRLDAAESDDPQGVVQAFAAAHGRSALRASVGDIVEAMHWPGKDLVIKQAGGVVAFSSDGKSRVYQPWSSSHATARQGRDARPLCGWQGASLRVSMLPDDDGPMIEIRYRVSSDRRRLLQKITQGTGRGRLEMVRVWKRIA
ncbi:MAG: hypothetical protein HKM03_02670 [Steroidobacteraceae bacterium]|nr:hypothetical protein [Steroidobacteraceae bacterium]